MANRINTILLMLAVGTPLAHGKAEPSGQAAKAGSPRGAAPGVTKIVDSRLGIGRVDSQLEILRTRMAINFTDVGPFGFYQDPEKAAKQVIDLPIAKPEKLEKTPLQDVVKAIPISMVIPSAQEFYVNSRKIRTGDQFPLVVGNQTIRVRVERVRSSGVVFRDTKTGEVAEKRMEFRPEGVIAAKGGEILPKGIIPTGKSSTEELVIDQTKINPIDGAKSR
jgi:hypothetical protein